MFEARIAFCTARLAARGVGLIGPVNRGREGHCYNIDSGFFGASTLGPGAGNFFWDYDFGPFLGIFGVSTGFRFLRDFSQISREFHVLALFRAAESAGFWTF